MAAALVLLCAPLRAWADDWPSIPVPSKSRMEWVAKDMRFNGVPMRVQHFVSSADPADVLSYYRQRWGGLGASIENTMGPWRVIGRQENAYYLTVQIKPRGRGGTEGFLGVSRLPALKSPPRLGVGFPMMEDSRVLNDIENRDPGQQARTLLLDNRFSVESNALFYREQFIHQGWSRVEDRTLQVGRARVVVFKRSGEEAMLTLQGDGHKTIVTANLVQKVN